MFKPIHLTSRGNNASLDSKANSFITLMKKTKSIDQKENTYSF